MTDRTTETPRTEPTSGSPYREMAFPSGDSTCDGWHFRATNSALWTDAGTPCVVMAHGLAGTKDSGLRPFAEALAAGGFDVLAFDYRGFGTSGGTPRQSVSMRRQVADYRAAMDAATALPGVDPTRLVLWGASLSGGHVLAAAAERTDVAAVVALTPLVDGIAAARHAMRTHKPATMARSCTAAIRSGLATLRGGRPAMIPVAGRPGEPAALSLAGYYEDYLAMAGPSWRNEIDATVLTQLAGYRPARNAAQLRCPLLIQLADYDRCAPPHAGAKAAFAARAEVRHYPCDHFDVWPGKQWFDPAVEHQLTFLRRHLAEQE